MPKAYLSVSLPPGDSAASWPWRFALTLGGLTLPWRISFGKESFKQVTTHCSQVQKKQHEHGKSGGGASACSTEIQK